MLSNFKVTGLPQTRVDWYIRIGKKEVTIVMEGQPTFHMAHGEGHLYWASASSTDVSPSTLRHHFGNSPPNAIMQWELRRQHLFPLGSGNLRSTLGMKWPIVLNPIILTVEDMCVLPEGWDGLPASRVGPLTPTRVPPEIGDWIENTNRPNLSSFNHLKVSESAIARSEDWIQVFTDWNLM